MSDKIDIQQIIDDLDAAQAYVSPYVYRRHDDNTQVRMVESLKRASSILCRLTDSEVSLLGEVERYRSALADAEQSARKFNPATSPRCAICPGSAPPGRVNITHAANCPFAALSGNKTGEGE